MEHMLWYFRRLKHYCFCVRQACVLFCCSICLLLLHAQPLLLIAVSLEPGRLFKVVSLATMAT